MNAHPALWGYGIKFCLPGSTFYQGHLTLFSRRVVEPLKLQVVPAREFWMDECEWPDDAPSPGQVYDVAVKYGKVHPVTLEKFDTKPSWGALVQYFYPADADKLDESDADVNFCGWKV
jgi:hypothetical protein